MQNRFVGFRNNMHYGYRDIKINKKGKANQQREETSPRSEAYTSTTTNEWTTNIHGSSPKENYQASQTILYGNLYKFPSVKQLYGPFQPCYVHGKS